jgi:hypothetical protein
MSMNEGDAHYHLIDPVLREKAKVKGSSKEYTGH